MADSRLSRRTQKQGRKQLYWSLAGIVIILFVAINFGPLAIAAVGNTIDTIIGKDAGSDVINTASELKSPTLDPLPKATTQGEITISGTSFYSEGQIELFVNDIKQRSTKLSGQDFEIENVELKSGTNSIKAKIVQDSKESDFSDIYEISLVEDEPSLELISPSDGSSFEQGDQEIQVTGETDPDNTVTVNGFIAIVNSDGKFNYALRLSEGENKIKIVAENIAGNTSEKEITVSYSE